MIIYPSNDYDYAYWRFTLWMHPDRLCRTTVAENRSTEMEKKRTVDADRTNLFDSDIDSKHKRR